MNPATLPDANSIRERMARYEEGKMTVPLASTEHDAFMGMANEAGKDPNIVLRELFQRWSKLLPSTSSTVDLFDEPKLRQTLKILDTIALYRAQIDLVTPLPPLGENHASLDVHLGREAADRFHTLRDLGKNDDKDFLRRAIRHLTLPESERKPQHQSETMALELPVDLLEQIANIARGNRRGVDDVIKQSVEGWERFRELAAMAAPPTERGWYSGPIGANS